MLGEYPEMDLLFFPVELPFICPGSIAYKPGSIPFKISLLFSSLLDAQAIPSSHCLFP
jgi:hypothetical protein